MKSPVKISVISAVLLALLPACRRDARNENPDTPPPPAVSDAVVTVAGMTGEEIFRRGFWRQPTARDRIVQAVRREQRDSIGDPKTVQSWSWFIQLHPSPELLAALRAPDSFGLLRLPPEATPRPWSSEPPTPDWFPAPTALDAFEILQAPVTGLTVLYRANDDTLFATDTGSGFAPPIR